MKIMSIVGARPQFIKVAALHRAIIPYQNLQHLILHTGQHYDYNLSAIFFKELDIPAPDFYCNAPDVSEVSTIKFMCIEIEKILIVEKPDMVIVYGDTNTTLAGAQAAHKLHIKIAHIEAGLRSYNNEMPEEYNRVESDKISDLLFCPTKLAVDNLEKEGYGNSTGTIFLTGDIMLDAMNYYSREENTIKKNIVPKREFILCTLHRQALVTSPIKLKEVVTALNNIAQKFYLVMPAHPRLKQSIADLKIAIDFTMLNPVGYLEMIALLKHCRLVITDSGGLQKETYFSKKMCVTVREETEWKELVDEGVNFLAGDSSMKKIIETFETALSAKNNFEKKFYGDGKAAEIIVQKICDYLQNRGG